MPTYLITDLELTEGTPITGNVDIDKYRILVTEAQVFIVEKVLGTKLYEKILTDFAATTITGVYSTILTDYLKPILKYSVAAEYISMSGIEVTNAGILRRTPEDTTPATEAEIDGLAAKLRGKADIYLERLQRYLQFNQASITEYTYAQDDNWDIDPDKKVNTYGGWRVSGNRWGNMTSAEREIWRDIWHDLGR